MIGSPAASNQRATSPLSAADPEIITRIRPPVRAWILENTSLSAMARRAGAIGPGGCPARCLALISVDAANAQSKILALAPPPALALALAPW